jgi:hypothetical protein
VLERPAEIAAGSRTLQFAKSLATDATLSLAAVFAIPGRQFAAFGRLYSKLSGCHNQILKRIRIVRPAAMNEAISR